MTLSSKIRDRDLLLVIFIAVVYPLILFQDSRTPLGYADGILYTIPILISLYLNIPLATISLAALGVLCTFLGIFLNSEEAAKPEVYMANRWMSVGVIGASAVLGLYYQKIRIKLERTNQELADAMSSIKTLKSMLPICANCKKIRNDTGYWEQIDSYISTHTDTDFSHGICPDCFKLLYGAMSDGKQDNDGRKGSK